MHAPTFVSDQVARVQELMEGNRRLALVVGSQCENMPRLSFLPPQPSFKSADLPQAQRLVFDLVDHFEHSEYGACRPVELSKERLLGDLDATKVNTGFWTDGLVVNPDIAVADNALRAALEQANEARAVLIVMYVGHGSPFPPGNVEAFKAHYLQTWNASSHPSTGKEGWNMLNTVAEFRPNLLATGIVALIDACYASYGGEAVKHWFDPTGKFRFSWLGSSSETQAFDACFSRTLLNLMKQGIAGKEQWIGVDEIEGILDEECKGQEPIALRSKTHVSRDDPGLWIWYNHQVSQAAATAAIARRPIYDLVRQLTADFVPPPQLAQVVADSTAHRTVVVVGPAGSGKSVLAAALQSPDLTDDVVPAGFVDAIGFVELAPNPEEMAGELAAQLEANAPGYGEARRLFELRNQERWGRLGILDKDVIGPLTLLEKAGEVRIVLDGLDNLQRETGGALITRAINDLASDSKLAHVRLILTSRPEGQWPEGAHEIALGEAEPETAAAYVAARGIADEDVRSEIVDTASGNWLLLKLLTEVAMARDREPMGASSEPNTQAPDATLVGGAYGSLIEGAITPEQTWDDHVAPMLAVLAAAGVGPVLPMPLFYAAVALLGGPSEPNDLIGLLTDPSLQPLIVRSQPGTGDERVGLFHGTLLAYLESAGSQFAVRTDYGHLALALAIESIAPIVEHDHRNPLHEYAEWMQPRHFWDGGEPDRAIDALVERRSPIPTENLYLLESWLPYVEEGYGETSEQARRVRHEIAHFTGASGAYRQAADRFEELAELEEELEGEKAPTVVRCRREMAEWLIEDERLEEIAGAILELADLAERRMVELPEDHDEVLAVRAATARALMKIRRDAEALDAYRQVLADEWARPQPDRLRIIQSTRAVAVLTGRAGKFDQALGSLKDLMRRQLEEFDFHENDPDVFRTEARIAEWTGRASRSRRALELYAELYPRMANALGQENPEVLRLWGDWASTYGYSGYPLRAVEMLRDREEVVGEVFGTDHPHYLDWLCKMAHWIGEAGQIREASSRIDEAIVRLKDSLWPTAPDLLKARVRRAQWILESGRHEEALEEYQDILKALLEIYGDDNPEVLDLRDRIAWATFLVHGPDEGYRLRQAVLDDRVRVQGVNHPDTIIARCNLNEMWAHLGNVTEALDRYDELRPQVEAAQGPDHPDAFRLRGNIARWKLLLRDYDEARSDFLELIEDALRVLPEDNPIVLTDRYFAALCRGEGGDPDGAAEEIRVVIEGRRRILGPSHRHVLEVRSQLACYEGQTGDRDEAMAQLAEIKELAVALYGEAAPLLRLIDQHIGALGGSDD